MRHLAITGIETASWISRILSGSAMRATPPCARMSAGTPSTPIPAPAPASPGTRACSAVVTSMITPPLSISARPVLTRSVPISIAASLARTDRAVEAAQEELLVLLRRPVRERDDRVRAADPPAKDRRPVGEALHSLERLPRVRAALPERDDEIDLPVRPVLPGAQAATGGAVRDEVDVLELRAHREVVRAQ